MRNGTPTIRPRWGPRPAFSFSLLLVIFCLIHLLSLSNAQDIFAVDYLEDSSEESLWFGNPDNSNYNKGRQMVVLDVTNLGAGRDFYDRDSLQLQLGMDGEESIKTFSRVLGNSVTNQAFVGESESGDNLQLLRYISSESQREILVGSLVDLENKQIYQFQQQLSSSLINDDETDRTLSASSEERLLVQATITPSDDFPESAEPYQIDAAIREKLTSVHDQEDSAYFESPSYAPDSQLYVPLTITDPLNAQSYNDNDDDDITLISIMMVWTKNSECTNSNITRGPNCSVTAETEDNMRALIAAAIAETNAAYTLSSIPMQLELVHAYRHPTFDEYAVDDLLGIGTFGATLASVTFPWDGVLDDVPKIRRAYEADMVSMVIDDGTYCGVGFIGTGYFPFLPTAPFMYSINSVLCMMGTFVLAHELGHNFGCSHDRGTSDACSTWTDVVYNSYGWRDPESEFRTIMAYRCRDGQCDNNSGADCPTIPRFSEKDATFNGKAVGNGKNDCSRQIRYAAPIVSRFYGPERRVCREDQPYCQIWDALSVVSGLFCFAPEMTVHVLGKGDIPMRDLNAGDQALTVSKDGSTSYETIYTINHYHRTRATEFLQLHVNGGEKHPLVLELSKMHMVYVKGWDHPIPAAEIAVGDFVQVLPSNNNRQRNSSALGFDPDSVLAMQKGVLPEYAEVVEVQMVVRHGFYNPVTTTGRIVVNGIVASAYASLSAALQGPSSITVPSTDTTTAIAMKGGIIRLGSWNIISEQRLLDIMLSPHRMVSLWNLRLETVAKFLRKYKVISKRDDATEENTSDEFLSVYCSIGVIFTRWWEQQHHWLQVLAFLLVLFVFGVIYLFCHAMAFVSQQKLVLCALIGCRILVRRRVAAAGGHKGEAPRKCIE